MAACSAGLSANWTVGLWATSAGLRAVPRVAWKAVSWADWKAVWRADSWARWAGLTVDYSVAEMAALTADSSAMLALTMVGRWAVCSAVEKAGLSERSAPWLVGRWGCCWAGPSVSRWDAALAEPSEPTVERSVVLMMA